MPRNWQQEKQKIMMKLRKQQSLTGQDTEGHLSLLKIHPHPPAVIFHCKCTGGLHVRMSERCDETKRESFLTFVFFWSNIQWTGNQQMPLTVLNVGRDCTLISLFYFFLIQWMSFKSLSSFVFVCFWKEKNLTHHECLKSLSKMWQKWHFWHYLREFITGAKVNRESLLLIIYLCLPAGKLPLYIW